MAEWLEGTWDIPDDDANTLGNGRYRIASKLGEGGMAIVYRGWDTVDEEWRAVKVLMPEYARRAKIRQRFANEAQTMLKLKHRHIITVLDVGTDEPLPYIVMEIAGGGCVIDWVKTHGPMPPRMAVDVVMQSCKALNAAHKIGIVHRDVKPHNILISTRGVCRLTDFGIAQVEDLADLTKTGSVMGTLGYMAPEQRTDAKNIDVRADVYGLGATLYKLLTGGAVADLFLAEHDNEMLEGVPESLVPVLLRATAYRPDGRYDTVAELARALHETKSSLVPTPEDTPPLAMALPTSPSAPLVTSGASEPTFDGLPQTIDQEPMLDEPATIDQSDSLVPPGSPRAGVDRQRTQPNEITADSDLTSLPYVMSRADGKRGESDPDYVPDYIDKSSIPTAEKAMVLGVDDETKQLAEEARAAAIRDGQLDEDGNPIGEKPQLEPEAEGGLDVMENIQEIVDTILKVVWAAVARPIQIVAISGSVLLLTFGLALGQSTMHVRAAEVEALSARGQFYKAIVAEQRIVDDLSALGADNTMLSSRWFAFADAEEEPTKMDAAGQLMATLSNTARILERSEGAAVRPHKVHIVRERLGRIDRVRRDYDQKMLEWEKVADSTRGRLAIRFGVAPAPD